MISSHSGLGADAPREERSAWPGPELFVALAIIGLLLWGFGALADEFSEQGRITRLDLAVLNWLQQHGSEKGESVFVFVSWLGAPVLFAVDLVVFVAFAIRRQWRSVTLWTVAVVGGVALDEILKLAFRRVRPGVASEFISRHSWSFPSGHAMNSLVSYAMLAYLLRQYVTDSRSRIAMTIGFATLILAIGFSRLYLGVHYFSDVTAGYLAGSAWVIACVTTDRYAFRRAPTS